MVEISLVVARGISFAVEKMLIAKQHNGLLCAGEEHRIYFDSIFMLFLIDIHLFN